MRKLAALISAVACLLALAACSQGGGDGEPAASALRAHKRAGANKAAGDRHSVRSAPPRLSGCSSYYALTFDDGPNPVYTPKVKAALDSLGVRATFFLIGEEVDADPALARSLVDGGNWVGNHSYTHPYLTELGRAEVKDQLERTSRAIWAATGVSPEFARPPDGEFNDETLSVFDELGLRNTIWTIDTNDWRGNSVARMVSEAVKVKPGGIILMHDAYPTTVTAVPQIVNQLRQKGMCPGKLTPSPTPIEAAPAWPGVFFSVMAVKP